MCVYIARKKFLKIRRKKNDVKYKRKEMNKQVKIV